MKYTHRTPINLIGFDCDGTLTDGTITLSETDEQKSFSVKDGYGITQLLKQGKHIAILTARKSSIVTRRAQELQIQHCIQHCKDKPKAFTDLATSLNIPLTETCFMGDDIPDLALLKLVALRAAPIDAHPKIKEVSDWISTLPAGYGAARELCDYIIDEGL